MRQRISGHGYRSSSHSRPSTPACTVGMSVPDCNKCVAKLWRKVCTETGLKMPACATAFSSRRAVIAPHRGDGVARHPCAGPPKGMKRRTPRTNLNVVPRRGIWSSVHAERPRRRASPADVSSHSARAASICWRRSAARLRGSITSRSLCPWAGAPQSRIHVLDPQAQAFHQPHASAVQQAGHQGHFGRQRRSQSRLLGYLQNRGNALGRARALHAIEP